MSQEQEQYVSLQELQNQLNNIDQELNTDIAAMLQATLPDEVQSFIAEAMEFSLNVVIYQSNINYDYYIKIRCNDAEYIRILDEDLPVKLSDLALECWTGNK